ncbi:MAG TPA: hypothetical protein DD437_10005 [Rhodobiaceae bacterium]|nr:hypothetical protein [Rhodobiaceae bacterium]
MAADSAVTIQAGSKEEKIFDTADKLFELSNSNAIGVMVYNGMSFMEAPLPSLIRQFRTECANVERVEQAAEKFLGFLNEFAQSSPQRVQEDAVRRIVIPVLSQIKNRYVGQIQRGIAEGDWSPDQLQENLSKALDNEISLFTRIYKAAGDAKFVGGKKPVLTANRVDLLQEIIAAEIPIANDGQKKNLLAIARLAVSSVRLSQARTGIVVAGFGAGDLFPTLVSYEIDGSVFGRLKYVETNLVNIDRDGHKARVLPFAQKEMVERFLYGLDEDIEREVTLFCKRMIPIISDEILTRLKFDDPEDLERMKEDAKRAEHAFSEALKEKAFEEIRPNSREEIEDMVEFMPKPEMAKMAEALINLTSIKRRVSRGMETVGGPIDVAVISQSEGFVWVRRKHYFPEELNSRYFKRMRST